MAGLQVHGRLVELGGRGRRHRRLAKLRDRREEWHKRGQPHGRLAEMHGGLAELSGRRRLHHHLAKLGGRGHPHRRLAKLHGRLIELGERRCSHCHLAEPSERGQSHSHLTEPGLEEWQKCSPTEEDENIRFGKMARGVPGSGQSQPKAVGRKRS